MECDTSHGGIALGHYRFVRCLVDSHTVLLASFIKLRAYQYMKFEKFKRFQAQVLRAPMNVRKD